MLLGDELQEKTLGHHGVGDVKTRELALLRTDLDAVTDRQHPHLVEAVDDPVVKRTVHLKLERAHRVGHALERVFDRMREIVHRIDAPLVAEMIVRDVADADVRRSHVDLRAEAPFAVRVLAVAHLVEDLEIALGSRIARGTGLAGFLGNAAVFLPLVLSEIAAVGLSLPDQILGDLVHRVEHVRGVVEAGLTRIAFAGPLEAEPVDVLLDVLGVLVGLLGRIRVVESEVALAIKELGHAEVNADGLGVSDMNVAVRFRRKTRNNLAAGLAVGNVLFNPLTEKMTRSI